MVLFWISVVPPELTITAESSGLVLRPVKAGFIGSARVAAFAV